jgi:cytochrome bd-type quinol oxidase subunit 1
MVSLKHLDIYTYINIEPCLVAALYNIFLRRRVEWELGGKYRYMITFSFEIYLYIYIDIYDFFLSFSLPTVYVARRMGAYHSIRPWAVNHHPTHHPLSSAHRSPSLVSVALYIFLDRYIYFLLCHFFFFLFHSFRDRERERGRSGRRGWKSDARSEREK